MNIELRVSITGSDGFIGSWLKNRLSENGIEVRTLNRAKEDLLRPTTLKEFVSGSSVVLHFAGKNRASDCELYESNTAATLGLVKACELFGSKPMKMIYASSMQVYATMSNWDPIDEDHPVSYESAFSNSKLFAESVLQKWTDAGTITGIIMRIANTYGPGCRPYYNSVIATFLDRARKAQNLEVNGGSQSRDFIFVSDVVDAAISLIRHDMSGFHVFNIATGKPTTILQVAQEVNRLYPNISIDLKETNDAPKHIVGDARRAQEEFGFKASIGIRDGIKKSLLS